ncbi:DEAD/DEAH box helicase [Pseudoalteromonas arctica]|uniref:AAA domain-containing protein n=3 Tax=Gammaproteobacteria TaxID=1236 RepID=A0ABU9TLI4_9GAMM
MELLNTKCLQQAVVELTFEDKHDANKNWQVGKLVELFEESGSYYAKQGAENLFSEVSFNNSALAISVSHSIADSVISVACYKNSNALAVRYAHILDSYNEDITFKLENIVIDAINKIDRKVTDFKSAEEWLFDQFIFTKENHSGVFVEFIANSKTTFHIIGIDYKAIIDKVKNEWLLTSIRTFDGVYDNLYVYYGEHRFTLESIETQLKSNKYQLSLEQHLQDSASYFRLWQKYSEMDWQQHERVAKAAGFIEYTAASSDSDEEIRFKFKVGSEKLKHFFEQYKSQLEMLGESYSLYDAELQISKEPPSWLSSTEHQFESDAKPLLLSKIAIKNDDLIANLRQRPPQKGVMYVSLNGVLKQHERKQTAFKLLKESANPLPQLKFILEGIQPPEVKVKKVRAVTSSLEKQLQGKSLTSKQEKALKVALNTPDIALIIGPPGTGKTQVISAIQQRIAEEGNKLNASLQHQVLLTSYQHDAVDNVVARSGVFGLPAIKVGGKVGDLSQQQTTSVDSWTQKIINKLAPEIEKEISTNSEFQLIELITSTIFRIKTSIKPHDIYEQLKFLQEYMKRLAIDFGIKVSQQQDKSIERLLERFSVISAFSLTKVFKEKLLVATRAVRTKKVAYADDGELRLAQLITILKESDTTCAIASKFESFDTFNVNYKKLSTLKNELIEAIQDTYILPNQRWLNSRELKSLNSLVDELELSLMSTPRLGQLYFRNKYLEALSVEKKQVKSSLSEYSAVLGATCQQAAGAPMAGIKSVEHSRDIHFDSVIVDEAARANPLDLMIPMAMASRRVVLVGDHRQLPHMLEPKVEKELQEKNEVDITDQELLKQSLFERLYHSLMKFEQDGSSDHKRVVMLDTQFRMHPELGAFISREFYELFGLPPIKAGLDDSNFPLDVPHYEGKLAAWINVTQAQGKMRSKNGSKYRDCEATIVADEAYRILQARPDLSVGIITFYAAQRDLIIEKMISNGVMEKSVAGNVVATEYTSLSNGDERFRVGSVDAFQGKEFDVVLLSTVRHWQEPDTLTKESVNNQLGFLRIPNRINVAMSRQKRLLIVVGDKSLASEHLNQLMPEGESCSSEERVLVGFPKFYSELCQKEKGIVC